MVKLLLFLCLSTGVGCANPSFPTQDQNFEFVGYLNDTVVLFDGKVGYQCLSGHYWDHDFDLSVYEVTCQEDGTWSNDMEQMFCQLPSSKIPLD